MQREFITVTGRRVVIRRMTGREESIIFEMGADAKKSDGLAKELIRSLVTPELRYDELLLGEETDILYLIRLMSLGPSYNLSVKLGSRPRADYQVDLRQMIRYVLECADPACACHEVADYDEGWVDNAGPNDLTCADFERIPAGHYESAPQDLTFTTSDGVHKARLRFSQCKDKADLGRWLNESDPHLVSKHLTKLTLELNGETDRIKIQAAYGAMYTSQRYEIRDFLEQRDCGVDVGVTVATPQGEIEGRVEMGGLPFWIPRSRKQRRRPSR